MKRKGYPDGYDKDVVYDTPPDEITPTDTPYEKLEKNFLKRKKKVRMNALELCIGIVLLVFCWNYLQGHPAEKSSLITGFEVIRQKVNVFLASPNGNEAELLREKYDLQRSFEELLSLARNGQCLSVTEVEEVKRLSESLEHMSVEDFEDKYYALIQFASKTYTKAKQACDPEDEETEEEELPEEEKELTEEEFQALLDESLEAEKNSALDEE